MGRDIADVMSLPFSMKGNNMNYKITCRRHSKSDAVFQKEYTVSESQFHEEFEFSEFNCHCAIDTHKQGSLTDYQLHLHFDHTLGFPMSVEFSTLVENWKRENYVFAPGAVYNGNRFVCDPIAYPPYHQVQKENALTEPSVITDIPHLSNSAPTSSIQLLSGDMSIPAIGYYDFSAKRGFLMFAPQLCGEDATGFSVWEDLNAGTLRISITAPGVREKYRYFFGEKADGSGFYPDAHSPSDDTGRYIEAGEELDLPIRIYDFAADSLSDFFLFFHRQINCLETGTFSDVVPFSTAYYDIKEKYQQENYIDEGYYGVGVSRNTPLNFWQAGWVGGGMNNYPFLLEDNGVAFERAFSTFRFILDKLQFPSGWVCGIYANGVTYGEHFDFSDSGSSLLVRKDADLLYFLIKQAMLLEEKGLLSDSHRQKLALFADAFVSLFEKYGQLGQFIDAKTGEMLVGRSASAAIACAALALAGEFFNEERYLQTAAALGDYYYDEYVSKGILNGGPGEICQAPDSESAFGMLEGYVQLYETLKDKKWLRYAEETFLIAITWVMSYDFKFPAGCTAARRSVHTLGTVFANAQNKHSAPGICTLSGSSILKLYRFTGNQEYLYWMKAISHSIPQFVSLPERPVLTLDKVYLKPGYINERVQTSDWEGKETVGGFLNGSNWPEVTMMLTYTEVPGVYVDFGTGVVETFDHVCCTKKDIHSDKVELCLTNNTDFDATVTILADDSRNTETIRHNYFAKMQQITLQSRQSLTVTIHHPSQSV